MSGPPPPPSVHHPPATANQWRRARPVARPRRASGAGPPGAHFHSTGRPPSAPARLSWVKELGRARARKWRRNRWRAGAHPTGAAYMCSRAYIGLFHFVLFAKHTRRHRIWVRRRLAIVVGRWPPTRRPRRPSADVNHALGHTRAPPDTAPPPAKLAAPSQRAARARARALTRILVLISGAPPPPIRRAPRLTRNHRRPAPPYAR